jgi:hypothetical protein
MKEAEPPSETQCFFNQTETMENIQTMYQFNIAHFHHKPL